MNRSSRLAAYLRSAKLISLLFISLGWPACSFGQTGWIPNDSLDIEKNLVKYGSARVIVGLDIPFKAMGALSSSVAVQQEATISNARQMLLNTLKANEVLKTRTYQTIPFVALTVTSEGYQKLLANPIIKTIELDRLNTLSLAESVPLIGGNTAWSYGFTGQGQVIAIIDTGVQKTHPFIGAAKVVAEACFGSNDLRSSSSTFCPNPNENGDSFGVDTGVNCPRTIEGCFHGTHIAGIAAGNGANANQYFSGVAKDAQIAAIQIFSRIDSANQCSPSPSPCLLTWNSDLNAALEWVFQNRASFQFAAVNLSLGGSGYEYTSQAQCDSEQASTKAAIDNLRSARIATIVSSGNDGFSNGLSEPACISSAISVGATTKTDQVASFSNSASFLDLLAPGVDIYSSVPINEYASFQGTSMATPFVAGAFALLRQADPASTVDMSLQRLVSTGTPITDSRNNITKPRINLERALTLSPSTKTSVSGRVSLNGSPVCARVLANGVGGYSCDAAGNFFLADVPVDGSSKITLFAWADGMNPYKNVFTPLSANTTVSILMSSSPCGSTGGNLIGNSSGIQQTNLSGNVYLSGTNTPVCASVLANGVSTFSCDGTGAFSLAKVPVDSNGQVTLFAWADGFLPHKLIFKPSSTQERHDLNMKIDCL